MTEDELYDEQAKLIEEEYGADAANHANYGSFVDEWEDGTIQITTKIYVDLRAYLVSTLAPDGTCEHDWH